MCRGTPGSAGVAPAIVPSSLSAFSTVVHPSMCPGCRFACRFCAFCSLVLPAALARHLLLQVPDKENDGVALYGHAGCRDSFGSAGNRGKACPAAAALVGQDRKSAVVEEDCVGRPPLRDSAAALARAGWLRAASRVMFQAVDTGTCFPGFSDTVRRRAAHSETGLFQGTVSTCVRYFASSVSLVAIPQGVTPFRGCRAAVPLVVLCPNCDRHTRCPPVRPLRVGDYAHELRPGLFGQRRVRKAAESETSVSTG